MIKKALKNKKGEGYIDVVVGVLIITLIISFAVNVYPVFIAKNQLNQFSSEIIRVAEISGEIGSEVNNKIKELEDTLIDVDSITWNTNYIPGTKKVQIDEKISVEVNKKMDIGFFIFGSFPINLSTKDVGNSEVYHK